MNNRPILARIRVFPFKGLDPQEVASATVVRNGSLKHDREFALFDAEGRVVSGKREKKIHRIRSQIDFETEVMRFRYGRRTYEFSFSEEKAVEDFFSEILGYRVFLRRSTEGGFPDDRKTHGPTVVSRATLTEIAGWFALEEENVRRRFRTNLEIENVPPFWEDRLVRNEGGVTFRIGEVLLIGEGISRRCPVPTRDPDSGEELPGFVKRFVEMRERSLPRWSPKERFADTFYRLCINTSVPASEVGKTLRVGDEVEIL